MKIFKTIAMICGITAIAAVAGLTYQTRTVDPRAWWAAVQVWRLNHGMVSIQDFDWHLLKVGSGKYGERALQDLRRHGATDDIRITADYVLTRYVTPDSNCTDSPCGFETSMKNYKPVAGATTMKKDLRPGQVLPHEFIVDTALSLPACTDCVLRMQDFDGDGQDEVYVEGVRRTAPTAPEDESRAIYIYRKDKDGWRGHNVRVLLYNFDARTYPQRPFAVEQDRMDMVRINGGYFQFVNYPNYQHPSYARKPLSARAAQMRPLGAHLASVPVIFPRDGHMPDGLAHAMSAGAIGFAPNIANPVPPGAVFDYTEPTAPDYAYPPACGEAEACRAIVADLDHDGHDEVILMTNAPVGNSTWPGDATLFKSDDGKTWRVATNVELCRDIVPDIAKAKIEIVPPNTWRLIRLGQDLYPIIRNPYCDKVGTHL